MANDKIDGIAEFSRFNKKVEPLIGVDRLRSVYLFGIDIFDNTGNELPDATYQQYIDNAVSELEHYLDISVVPEKVIEERDYHFNDYQSWGYFQLNNFPVVSVDRLTLAYFRGEDGEPEDLLEIPRAWIRIQRHDGIVRLIPNSRYPGSLTDKC